MSASNGPATLHQASASKLQSPVDMLGPLELPSPIPWPNTLRGSSIVTKPSQLIVIINDLQVPFQDKSVLTALRGFIHDLAPDMIIFNGDIVDCYTISQFNKDPLTKESLASEILQAQRLMHDYKHIPVKLWIGGNHEDRLRRFIWNHAAPLGMLPELQFDRLFKLQEYGFDWLPYGDGYSLGKLYVTHGELVRKDSGATARAHYDKYRESVLTGHTHRLGVYYKTCLGKTSVAFENGCLCQLHPEWARNPDWQQGFSVVHHDVVTGEFNVQQIPIFKSGDRKVFYYGAERIMT